MKSACLGIAIVVVSLTGCRHKAVAPAKGVTTLPQPRKVEHRSRPKAVVKAAAPKPAQPGAPLSDYIPTEQRAESATRYESAFRAANAHLAQVRAKGTLTPDMRKIANRAEAALQQAQAAYKQGNVAQALIHTQRATVLIDEIANSR